jgi:hypothetical protein
MQSLYCKDVLALEANQNAIVTNGRVMPLVEGELFSAAAFGVLERHEFERRTIGDISRIMLKNSLNSTDGELLPRVLAALNIIHNPTKAEYGTLLRMYTTW